MRHEPTDSSESTISILPFYKAFVGTLLLTGGVVLGVYVAMTAFGLIRGQQPPKLVQQIATQAAPLTVVAPNGDEQPALQIPADVMRACGYLLTCFLLSLPTLLASALLNAGTRLLHGDTTDALQKIAQKLTERSNSRR